MSYGTRLSSNEQRLAVGQVHTNGLGERFEEHRRITKIEDGKLEFEIVAGRRKGSVGSCKTLSLWTWSRGEVAPPPK